MSKMSALSVRQPYAEQIMRNAKRFEYRTVKTLKRGRVYIYASKTPGDPEKFAALGLQAGDLPTGVLIGTVDIIDCTEAAPGQYDWHLANPERLAEPIKPKRKPQPVWFFPF